MYLNRAIILKNGGAMLYALMLFFILIIFVGFVLWSVVDDINNDY